MKLKDLKKGQTYEFNILLGWYDCEVIEVDETTGTIWLQHETGEVFEYDIDDILKVRKLLKHVAQHK